MIRLRTLPLAAALLAGLSAGAAAGSIGSAVTLELCTNQGSLPLYPVSAARTLRKAYAEAVPDAAYRIRVHNRLARRVGVVIAVDGRNIISGGQSWLGNGERMYVLAPGETQELAGWRTSQDKVNRFYFTTVPDAYAAAFGDTSAMGVVAMAVYPEVAPVRTAPCPGPRASLDRAAPAAPAPPVLEERRSRAKAGSGAEARKSEAAGTGYGEEIYAPSREVRFEPVAEARETCCIKYEWRATLVRLGVLREPERPRNRLWDAGYCPPPPGLRGL
jgi:hypothetical protein